MYTIVWYDKDFNNYFTHSGIKHPKHGTNWANKYLDSDTEWLLANELE